MTTTPLSPEPPSTQAPSAAPLNPFGQTSYKMLSAISLGHFLNDATQSLLVPLYPLFRGSLDLSFTQIGLITLTYQLIASFMQPVVGWYTDRHPQPFSLPIGMIFTLSGLFVLSVADSYPAVLIGASLMGTGSSVFHPESSRMARLAAGGQFGLAQSVFQVGGNAGTSCGPLLATVVMSLGQWSVALFSVLPLTAIVLLTRISLWAKGQVRQGARPAGHETPSTLPQAVVTRTIGILLVLVFAKDFYMAGLISYLIFYLEFKFALPVQAAQIYLFLFLFAAAAGTVLGGPIGDRIGRKCVICTSILGAAPFSLALPYANLFWTGALVMVIGFILASAFSTIVVFAQELMPGKIGTVAGLFFGLSFGAGGVGAAVLGKAADVWSIGFVYQFCSFLPLIGLLSFMLPDPRRLLGEHGAGA